MRESRIDKETHSAMLKHYYQKQEEEKKMREDDDDSYMESNFLPSTPTRVLFQADPSIGETLRSRSGAVSISPPPTDPTDRPTHP